MAFNSFLQKSYFNQNSSAVEFSSKIFYVIIREAFKFGLPFSHITKDYSTVLLLNLCHFYRASMIFLNFTLEGNFPRPYWSVRYLYFTPANFIGQPWLRERILKTQLDLVCSYWIFHRNLTWLMDTRTEPCIVQHNNAESTSEYKIFWFQYLSEWQLDFMQTQWLLLFTLQHQTWYGFIFCVN